MADNFLISEALRNTSEMGEYANYSLKWYAIWISFRLPLVRPETLLGVGIRG
jgi:hypothetical protein